MDRVYKGEIRGERQRKEKEGERRVKKMKEGGGKEEKEEKWDEERVGKRKM